MYINKREKEDNEYQRLQEKTLKRIEELCSKVWTDYNIHDPGITIADNYNYALYELNYRLEFPYETYLLEEGEQDVSFDRKGMLTKEQLFSGSIVTEYDYEQLFLKKFPQLEMCSVLLDKKTRHYNIIISLHEEHKTSNIEDLTLKIKETYHQNRNLGENLNDVYIRNLLQNNNQYYQRSIKNIPQYKQICFLQPDASMQVFQKFLTDYHSIQFDFPDNYGIGHNGISPTASLVEKAKIMQLKAYLLIIDTVMADILQQAGNLRTLFDFSGKIPFSKFPEVLIPESSSLIDSEGIKEIQLHSESFYNQQKSYYLDLLDTFYGEDTYSINTKESPNLKENERRAKLIHLFPELNATRFKACNINEHTSEPVIQTIMNQLTNNKYENPESNTLSKYGLRVISDEDFFEKYKFLKNFSFGFNIEDEHLLLKIENVKVDYNESSFHELRKNINLLWYNVLFESFLNYADNSEYYRILILPESEYLLVFKHPEKSEWINMGLFFKDITFLTRIANLFWEFMRKIKNKKGAYNFYFIEHILLSGESKDPGKISIITSEEGKSEDDKRFIERLLTERLPAHLLIYIYYVPSEQLNKIEHLYSDWRKALESANEAELTTFEIENFLHRNFSTYAKAIY